MKLENVYAKQVNPMRHQLRQINSLPKTQQVKSSLLFIPHSFGLD